MEKTSDVYYYDISVSYEIPYDIMNSSDPEIVEARKELLGRLTNSIPSKYEKFSVKIVIYQLKDTLNYLVTYTSFFRSCEGLPMREYVSAREIKESVESELEEFFERVDCEYRRVNIKTFSSK